ncbi:hypothetical protein [Streptomyces scabiei]|uniref:hypothetical protein n=1 Tax=Streptomyces scabiei TaxID=1930 RepID=UPI003F4D5F0F
MPSLGAPALPPSHEEFHLANPDPEGGRPPKHAGEFVYGARATRDTDQTVTVTETRLCGTATAQAWSTGRTRG